MVRMGMWKQNAVRKSSRSGAAVAAEGRRRIGECGVCPPWGNRRLPAVVAVDTPAPLLIVGVVTGLAVGRRRMNSVGTFELWLSEAVRCRAHDRVTQISVGRKKN